MSEQDIAIVGMAGRFPGAADVGQFWENLRTGTESIRTLSDDELLAAGVARGDIEDPSYVKVCPVLADIDKFDAAFFGFSPREASVMDPAHRFFLEVAWEALEHSGNTGLDEEGCVGVFAAAGGNYYLMDNVRTNAGLMAEVGEFLARHTGNDMNFLATRASYELDLRGPSVNIQTACSSTLAALHHARVSLLRGECDIALVGASAFTLPMGQGYKYKEGEILSPDGHCRPFDHRSAGTVFGSGTGCFVLKRLQAALDNGDTIYGLVKGSAINNDGALKVGYLAPGVEKQVDVIKAALKSANAEAESISYVETHGTGTSVGDPIELTALSEALSASTSKRGFCGVGSVKSNIGHLGEAAATASLAKMLLAFAHKQIPATLGFERPNPQLSLEDGPLYVVDRLTDWKSEGPRRCGITALGAGGTNVHVILEEPPASLPGEGGRDKQLLVLSASSRAALDRMSIRLADAFELHPELDLADAAYTLSVGRRPLEYRRVLTASTLTQAAAKLRSGDPKFINTSVANLGSSGLVFTFPGGGAQYAGMGADLYASEEVYREAMDECLTTVDEVLDVDLRQFLFASPEHRATATRELEKPSRSLPALFATEYALARLFESWGLNPVAMIGHSMGEYVAACLAGVFTVADGIRLVVARGKLFETTQPGKMVAISLPEAEVRDLMPAGLSIAAVNAPDLCVASGPGELIETFKEQLTRADVDWTAIHIEVAAHSSMLEPILERFRSFCRNIQFQVPNRSVLSNLTGTWLSDEQAVDPEYWVQHLRNTVRFSDCVETVLRKGSHVFLEIGPGRTLTTLVSAQKTKVTHSINSVRHFKEEANDLDYALMTAGKVWAAGAAVDWTAFYQDQLRNRIALPTYPFEKSPYWVKPGQSLTHATSELRRGDDMEKWFSTPCWVPSPVVDAGSPASSWLIVSDDGAVAEQLSQRLTVNSGNTVYTAVFGPALRRVTKQAWRLDPKNPAHFNEIFEALDAEGALPEHTVFAIGLSETVAKANPDWKQLARTGISRLKGVPSATDEPSVSADYFALVRLAKALASFTEQGQLSVVTSRSFDFDSKVIEARRLLLGPALVISRELPELRTRFVDVAGQDTQVVFNALTHELTAQSRDKVVLLRNAKRWIRSFQSIELSQQSPQSLSSSVAEHSTVVISGGLGGIALVVAKHLAQRKKLRFALLSRSVLPQRAQWEQLLRSGELPPGMVTKLQAVMEIEGLGSRVMCVQTDVADFQSVKRASDEIVQQWGPIKVLIHAAGVIDDGPFQTKSEESMLRVLAPKVEGTLHLERAMGESLELCVLFSSVASLLGLPGQIDYTAANAFLDAVADRRNAEGAAHTVVINWNAWRDVGMVADGVARGGEASVPTRTCRHPWFLGREDSGMKEIFVLDLNSRRDWLLSEHKINGASSLIPGTGFIELLRAAAAEDAPDATIELSEVRFLAPFQVADDQTRRMQIELMPANGGLAATILSLPDRTELVSAQVRPSPSAVQPYLDLPTLKQRCDLVQPLREGGFLDQDFVEFGPRWGNIKRLAIGVGEALIELELDERFKSDLPTFAFHPALMDMATGGAQCLLPGFDVGQDFYVPFAYEKVLIFGSLTRHCVSHVRLDVSSLGDLPIFNIQVADLDGKVLIEIQGFTMKRARKDAAIVQKSQVAGADANQRRALEELLREAIRPDEGSRAFERVISQSQVGQVVTSSIDIGRWWSQLESQRISVNGDASAEETVTAFSRPELGTEYKAPENAMEECLAGMWSKLLGVASPGTWDDFFALGGDSLVAVRFFARVKKQLGVTLPISTLFQAPTIRALAQLLEQQGVEVSEGKRQDDPTQKQFVPFATLRPKLGTSAAPQRVGLFRPVFRQTDSLSKIAQVQGGRCWLVFLDDVGLGRILQQRLSGLGDTVVVVRHGDGYARNTAFDYTVAPEKGRETYTRLLKDLVKDGKVPTDVLHMWLVTADESFRLGSSFFHRTQEEGCLSLLGFAQAAADIELDAPLNLTCVTNGIYPQELKSPLHDSKSTILGVLDCIPVELPRVRTRHVDLDLGSIIEKSKLSQQLAEVIKRSTASELKLQNFAEALLSEIVQFDLVLPIVLGDGQRFQKEWEPVRAKSAPVKSVKGNSTYLILGEPSHPIQLIASEIGKRSDVKFLWLRDSSIGPDRRGHDKVGVLQNSGLRIEIAECELTNRESVLSALKAIGPALLNVGGALLCGTTPERTLMQLLEPGAAEEELSEQVQFAQMCTSLMAELEPAAFVLLAGPERRRVPLDGEASSRGGGAFLAAHARLLARSGQPVTHFSTNDTHAIDEVLDEELARVIVGAMLSSDPPPSHLWWLASAFSHGVPLVLDEASDQAPTSVSRRAGAAEDEIVDLIKQAVQGAAVERYTRLCDVGISLLDAARLYTHIRNRYGLGLSVVEMLSYQSAFELAQLVQRPRAAEGVQGAFRHLVPMHPNHPGTGTPFFLVAGMFGNILNLRHLGRLLGADREVYGVQALGLFGDEKPHRRIEDMAEAYLREIRTKQPSGPYLLGGFSGGGLTAFEMAKRLRSAGEEVRIVIMLDTPLPQRPKLTYQDRLAIQKLRLQRQGFKYVAEWAQSRASWEIEKVRRKFHEIDESYSPGEFKYDAIQEAFLAAASAYRVGSYAGKVLLYRPALDKAYEVAPGRFVNSSRELVLEDQGWTPYVAEIEVHEVPGDHDHMVLEPEVRVLAGLMKKKLAEIDHTNDRETTPLLDF